VSPILVQTKIHLKLDISGDVSCAVHRSIIEPSMSSQHIAIEPDEIDDLPTYQPSTSTSQPHFPGSSSSTPQSGGEQVFGRIANVAGEVASDRRYTGGDTLDEPVSTTIVYHPTPFLFPSRTAIFPGFQLYLQVGLAALASILLRLFGSFAGF